MQKTSNKKQHLHIVKPPVLLFVKIIAVIMCALFISPYLPAAAATGETVNKTVKAGVFEFEGYHTKDEDGFLTGYGIEFLELVSKYSHINFEFVGFENSWDDMLKMLENGEIDIVTSARKTDERQSKFAYSLPIGRNKTVLWIQADDDTHLTENYDTYDGMTVGVLTGSSQNNDLEQFAKKSGFTYKITEFKDADKLAAALQTGEIDAILSSNLRKAENEKSLEVISEDYFYAIVRKEDTALINEVNYAIEQMNRNEGDWQNILFYRFYSPVYSSEFTFTQREEEYIKSVISGKKKITATADGDRKPYSYIENGELKGILPDYFADVMKIANLPYELVAPKDEQEYTRLLETKSVDIVLDEISLDALEDHSNTYGFNTDTYLTTGIAMIAKQGANKEISSIALPDTPGGLMIAEMLKDNFEILHYPTREEAIQSVLNGEADASYAYAYSAQMFVNEDTTNSLYYSVAEHINMDFQMSVLKETDHELFSILNKSIRLLPRDTLNNLILKYMSSPAKNLNFTQYMRAHPGIMLTLVLCSAGAAFAILILCLRWYWGNKILKSTEEANKKMERQLAIVESLSRDYLNIFAIDPERKTIKPIKLEGCAVGNFDKNPNAELPYYPVLEQYLDEHVYEPDRAEVKNAMGLDNIKKQMDIKGEFVGNYRTIENGKIHTYQYTYVNVAGRPFGEKGFILAGFRNIDETVKKEREQRETLQNALTEAQSANRAKTRFLNNMAHDIRTPMNAILGFSKIAANHIDNKEQVKDCLNKVQLSGKHLLYLINDILDMSRIESGKVEINLHICRLSNLIQGLTDIFQPQAAEKNLNIVVKSINVTNDYVMADVLKLNQILINLVGNSVKYTPDGGEILISLEQLPEKQPGYGDYLFKIKDTGIGMSAEFLKQIFDPFERDEDAVKSGIQGTGLGMAITRGLIEHMGGNITVKSQPGKGTEFFVFLQFKLATKEEWEAAYNKPNNDFNTLKSPNNFKGKRILLVDDNALNREVATIILEDAGFLVDTAENGKEAVAIIDGSKVNYYDAVLMDIQMPVMNGYEATNAIRALSRPDAPTLPIIAMTANAMEEDKDAALHNNMDAHLAKPIDIDTLTDILKKYLKD